MEMSPTIGKLADALCKAQRSMKPVSKDAKNPFYKSNYSTLAAVIESLREPFGANGLAFIQAPEAEADGLIIVRTMLMHCSGEYIISGMPGKPVKNDPQGMGSLVTYLKRYGLQAMAGIGSEDDDGNAASHGKIIQPQQDSTDPEGFNPKTKEHMAWFEKEMKKKEITEPKRSEVLKAMTGHPSHEFDDIVFEVMSRI